MVFCAGYGTDVFAGREGLKAVLGACAVHREPKAGVPGARTQQSGAGQNGSPGDV
ncbi:MAG: hypothetical protein ACRDNW_08440 [Trebonia sp.]